MKKDCCFTRLLPGLLLMLLLSLIVQGGAIAQGARAQTRLVRGVVTNSKGDPLLGVSVVLRGSTNGVVTDEAGKYAINALDTSFLVFSYVGTTTQEVPVNGQSVINIKLETDNNATTLNDVVVVGYGTQRKVNVIGSVVTVNSKDITAAPVSNVSNALAGRLPGAIIQQAGRRARQRCCIHNHSWSIYTG